MATCPGCAALDGLHLRGCILAPGGIGIGQRRQRTPAENLRWEHVKTAAIIRDRWACRRCGRFGGDVHHVTTVQQVLARGGTFADADRLDNVITLCRSCHSWCHAGVNYDAAIAAGLLIDPRALR